MADFDQYVKDSCIAGYNSEPAIYRNEARVWLTLTKENFYDLPQEVEYRQKYNSAFYARLDVEQKK